MVYEGQRPNKEAVNYSQYRRIWSLDGNRGNANELKGSILPAPNENTTPLEEGRRCSWLAWLVISPAVSSSNMFPETRRALCDHVFSLNLPLYLEGSRATL